MPDFPMLALASCLCHKKTVIQALLPSFISCHLIAGGLMVFSDVSKVSSFEVGDSTDDLVGAGKERKNECFFVAHSCSQIQKVEWKQSGKNCTAKLIIQTQMEQSGILLSALVLQGESFYITFSCWHVMCMASGVTILLADQHWKRSCLA